MYPHNMYPSGTPQFGCHVLYGIYEEPFMWYIVKFLLKIDVDEIRCFVICVIGVNETGK